MPIDRCDRIPDHEKVDIIMDAHIPEEDKSALLSVLRDRRVAALISTDYQLPDFSECRLVTRVIELIANPITEDTRERMRIQGMPIAEDDPEKHYIHFVGKDKAIVDLLVNSWYRKDYDLIVKITTAEVPSNPRNH